MEHNLYIFLTEMEQRYLLCVGGMDFNVVHKISFFSFSKQNGLMLLNAASDFSNLFIKSQPKQNLKQFFLQEIIAFFFQIM